MTFARPLAVACTLSATLAFAQQTPPQQAPAEPATQASPAQTPASPAPSGAQELPDTPGSQMPPTVEPTGPTVVMDTSMGRVTCRFFDKQAPETVANFIALAQGTKDWSDPTTHEKEHGKPLYNGTIFHRVIPGFMAQGGDPMGSGMGDPGYYIADEIDPSVMFDVPGRLAMANSGPNTDGSQFFITEEIQPSLNGHYTIFGQCDPPSVTVVKTITRVERDSHDKPLTPVVLKKVTIVPVGQQAPPLPISDTAPARAPAAPVLTPRPN